MTVSPIMRRKLAGYDPNAYSESAPHQSEPKVSASPAQVSADADALKQKFEKEIKQQQEQKKMARMVKSGILVMTEMKTRARRNAGSVLAQRSLEDRVSYCKYLQYEVGEPIFNVQYTTLHKAAGDGDFLGVKFFIESNDKSGGQSRAQVDDYDKTGMCPIHHAAAKNRVEIIELLVLCGCDVNVLTSDGMSAMMIAAKCGHCEAFRKLFYLGGDLSLKSRNDVTACHYAAQNDQKAIIALIHELFRENKIAAGHCTIEMTNENDLDAITSKYDKLSKLWNISITQEDVTRLEGLLRCMKAKVTDGELDLKKILGMPESAVLFAKTLQGMTPLHMAVENDCSNAVDVILNLVANSGPVKDADMDINMRDSVGETSLHKAARNKHYVLYRLLVQHGASETVTNLLKQTPKHLLLDE